MKIIERLKEKFGHKKGPILFTAINDYSAAMIPEKFYIIKDGKIKFNKFNEAEANEFIKLGNHKAIIEAIKNSCFLEGNIIHGFNQILERENHEEIMAFLNHPGGICLCQESSQKLIERGNHEEIMFAIENKNFCNHGYVYGVIEIIRRGNHEEIMGILKLTKIDSEIVDLIKRRGNAEEIKYISTH